MFHSPVRKVYRCTESREIDGLILGYLSFFACVRARSRQALERERPECGREDEKNNHQNFKTGLRSPRSLDAKRKNPCRRAAGGGAPQDLSDASQMSFGLLILATR
ncbi:jg18158 [Pararge aegeria aegeria]|uniref:Jg18158 protein n=1 Tax=Pararge aegeria aegeria TaxID=348720 RepID=A0A8S4SHA2_9NEOP|nr:jg18158 [Pararge aegeria aegeria]